jgi:hypothetical protein
MLRHTRTCSNSLCGNRHCRWAHMQGISPLRSLFHLRPRSFLSPKLDVLYSSKRRNGQGQGILTGERVLPVPQQQRRRAVTERTLSLSPIHSTPLAATNVSNHISTYAAPISFPGAHKQLKHTCIIFLFYRLDDPLTWVILPAQTSLHSHLTRWTLGASDIMFTNP